MQHVPQKCQILEEEAEVVEEGTAMLIFDEMRVGDLVDGLLERGHLLLVGLFAVCTERLRLCPTAEAHFLYF